MAIPSPTVPSTVTAVSAVRLNPTQNNRAFYIYSGLIQVTSGEITMLSVNDIGKRDVLLCLSVGCEDNNAADTLIKVKSNGTLIFNEISSASAGVSLQGTEYKFVLPANTSLEVTMQSTGVNNDWTVAGYGYYMESM